MRYAAFGWTVEGGPRTAGYVRQVLHSVERGQGWIPFIQKVLTDLFTQDNGAFIEVVRSIPDDPLSPVVSLNHLDAARCTRTGMSDTPVYYRDLYGSLHAMRYYEVITLEEMPSPHEDYHNQQYCLHRDATVLMADGKYRRIVDLVRSKSTDCVMSLSEGGLVPRRIVNWYENPRNGRKWVNIRGRRVQSNKGNRFKNSWVTEDHPVLTPRGYVDADKIQNGDKIVTSALAPNDKQTALLIGTLLGDASIPNHGTTPVLSMGHLQRNRDWLEAKIRGLRFLSFKEPNAYKTMLGVASKVCPALIEFEHAFYYSGKKTIPYKLLEKYLSPELLAAWYCDDGNISNRVKENSNPSARIGSQGTDPSAVHLAVDVLNKAGYLCSAVRAGGGENGDGLCITFSVAGSKKLFSEIARLCPHL